MITAIGVSIARAISRSRSKEDVQIMDRILTRLQSFEARLAAQDEEMKRLQEENAFLNRLLKHDGEGKQ